MHSIDISLYYCSISFCSFLAGQNLQKSSWNVWKMFHFGYASVALLTLFSQPSGFSIIMVKSQKIFKVIFPPSLMGQKCNQFWSIFHLISAFFPWKMLFCFTTSKLHKMDQKGHHRKYTYLWYKLKSNFTKLPVFRIFHIVSGFLGPF